MGKNKGIIGIIILSSLVVITIGIILVYKNQISNKPQVVNNSSSPSGQELNTFRSSSVMKFNISIPSKFQIEEKLGGVTISTPNGEIYIDKNGTNFENLEDYLNDLSKKNNFELKEKKILHIDNMPTVSGTIDGEKLYFIYVPSRVYTISTKVKALYPDLDQIAQSFRYIP